MFAARNMIMTGASGPYFDSDAAVYFAAIVSAGSSITSANKIAVNNFIVGCKSDGIWTAIKACCLLAGPDNLTGALVPLVGSAPTNNNFVSGDYSRTTGLKGNGTTKYLNSNRNNDADPQNSKHLAVYQTGVSASASSPIGSGGASAGSSQIISGTTALFRINTSPSAPTVIVVTLDGFWGGSRTSATSVSYRSPGVPGVQSHASATPISEDINVFRRGSSLTSDARLSYYSIGESIDLSLLESRLSTYVAALK
jgi:hypothetical protein